MDDDDRSASARRPRGPSNPAQDIFLRGRGEMAQRLRTHDWAATPLGPPAGWSQPHKALVSLMLDSTQPMFMAWGTAQTWLYNDAFIPILGRKHPDALGQPTLSVWGEARADLEPLFDRVFAGEPVHMQDIELQLDRQGRLEEAHFAFSYTPARDEHGAVAGLFGACIETTAQVLSERRETEAKQRQERLFEKAPGFIAVLRGPDHVFEFANRSYTRLVGSRELLGRPVRAAFPELEDQGWFQVLDRVFATGERFEATHVPVRFERPGDDQVDQRFLDFIYEPILDEAGQVTGIFVEGHDVSQAHRAQEALRANERRQALLVELGDRLRDLDDPADISFAAARLLGAARRSWCPTPMPTRAPAPPRRP